MHAPNPFKQIRQDAKLSQYRLAARAGVSKHAVLRLEQGMFADPLPKLLNFFVDEFNVSRGSLLHNYRNFQTHTRQSSGLLLGPIEEYLDDWINSDDPKIYSLHPLVYLRSRARPPLNPTQLAKSLCISQTVVTYFEKRPSNQKTVPAQLVEALYEAGYSNEDVMSLVNVYAVYRQMYINRQEVS